MNWPIILKTAIRDSRKDRSNLLIFMSSIVLGVTALVAINSFNQNLIKDIDNQSKTLLGADLTVTSNKKISEETISILDSLEGEISNESEMFSMAYFPKTDASHFIRIKAIEGDFPYYGNLLTEPKNAAKIYQDKNIALVDDGLMLQQSLDIGDSIKIGNTMVPIGGRLMTSFGSIDAGSSFAPPVYINQKTLKKSDLVQHGSFVNYSLFVKLNDTIDVEEWMTDRKRMFRDQGVRTQTVADQKENLAEAFSSLNNFLNLVALISLLLACIGVASSVNIYVKTKMKSIAILRCLGMNSKTTFMVYFLQIITLGTISVTVGVLMGSVIQIVLPYILKSLLPFDVSMSVSPRAMLIGFVVGVIITTLFALSPLLSIRNITPLNTLRVTNKFDTKDPVRYFVYLLIGVTIALFLLSITEAVTDAGILTIGLAVIFGILYLVSKIVTWGAKKYFPSNASYEVRQGISNLYRPHNQTQTLILSIGLGTAVLTVLFILQGLILNNVEGMGAGNQPNMILYGIESNQKQSLSEITTRHSMPILQLVPVVTMDLEGWKGKSKKEWLADTTRTSRRWAINREARVSYSETMNEEDQLLEGSYTGSYDGGDSIMISLDQRYAEGLDVSLGDELVWNVQGAIIKTYVGSIRKINFRKMESRFFILFPTGVLEHAPQFHILVTKSPNKQTTANYRNAVVKAMPNISVIDLGSILVTLNEIVSKVTYVIKFMAGFSILIGIIVLISSLLLSKYQRIRESVLLRTLGATEKKIFKINIVEYATLGALSAVSGITLAILGSFLLAKYVFELDFVLSWWPIVAIFSFIVLLTVIIGLWNSREVVSSSPLEVLRKI